MRALNEKEIVLLNVKFVAHMTALIIIALLFIFSFMKTSEAELAEINCKTAECEKTYRVQMELSDDIADFCVR